MTDMKDVSRDHAAYNIAFGLTRILTSGGDWTKANEGADMLRHGISEALELLTTACPKRSNG